MIGFHRVKLQRLTLEGELKGGQRGHDGGGVDAAAGPAGGRGEVAEARHAAVGQAASAVGAVQQEGALLKRRRGGSLRANTRPKLNRPTEPARL